MLRNWLADPEDTTPSFIRMTRNILVFASIASIVLLLLTSGVFIKELQNFTLSVLIVLILLVQFVSYILLLRGRSGMAKLFLPIAMFVVATYALIVNNGMHDINMLLFPIIIIINALLLRNKFIYISAPLAIVSMSIVAYADFSGITISNMASSTTTSTLFIGILLVVLVSALLQLLISRLNESVIEARTNEKAQIETNEKLMELQESLEKRIIERTTQLTEANRLGERRTRQFQTIAQISRLIVNIRDINELPSTVAQMISERFGYYHTGIFLLDDAQEYAILIAANSEGGQRMLQRGHRLRVAETSIVGYVASKGVARIALDTGSDAVYFNNPDLPDTHSEIAIPLQISNSIIGALDVQSAEPNAFIQEDIETLTTLADQVAIAIRNTQLLRETQIAIAESQILYGNMVKQAWKESAQTQSQIGYRFNGITPMPLESLINTPETRSALENGNISSGRKGSVAFPLKIRDETIGIININIPTGVEVGEDEVDIVRAAAERITLALENSSLLEESQRRALREQTIGEISAKIGAGTEIETILKTAVRELGAQIGGAQISVEIGSGDE